MRSPAFHILGTDVDIQLALGSNPVRIFPFGEAPEKTQAPYVTYFVVPAGTTENTLDCGPEMDRIPTQVDVWHKSAKECLELATLIRIKLQAHGVLTRFGGEEREPNTQLYRLMMEFDFLEPPEAIVS